MLNAIHRDVFLDTK